MADRRHKTQPDYNNSARTDPNYIPAGGWDEREHSADEFIVPAKGEDGEHTRQQFRCAPQLEAWMHDIVSSHQFPFKTTGDLMRWAVLNGCRLLLRIAPDIPSMQAIIDGQNAVVRRRELVIGVEEHLDQLAIDIEKMHKKKAWSQILLALQEDRAAAQSATIPEPYWGGVWLDQIKERFTYVEEKAARELDTRNANLRMFTIAKGADPEVR